MLTGSCQGYRPRGRSGMPTAFALVGPLEASRGIACPVWRKGWTLWEVTVLRLRAAKLRARQTLSRGYAPSGETLACNLPICQTEDVNLWHVRQRQQFRRPAGRSSPPAARRRPRHAERDGYYEEPFSCRSPYCTIQICSRRVSRNRLPRCRSLHGLQVVANSPPRAMRCNDIDIVHDADQSSSPFFETV